jgi:hypothetical protein
MNNINHMQTQWELFSKMVIPANASPVQRQEMRRAFYAGAEVMMRVNFSVGHPDYKEELGMVLLDSCVQELQKFAEDVAAGKA